LEGESADVVKERQRIEKEFALDSESSAQEGKSEIGVLVKGLRKVYRVNFSIFMEADVICL